MPPPPPSLLLPLLLLLLLLSLTARAQPAGSSVAALLVEGLAAPLGLATLAPRFSWRLAAASALRNVSQTHYQLRLGSTPASPGDVFDSGQTASAEASFVALPARALPLAAGQIYYADVRVWLVDASSGVPAPTAFTALQRFSVGLQSTADWAVSPPVFVGLPAPAEAPADGPSACPWLRTTFSLSAADLALVRAGAASALLHVASVGYHEAFVNGERLEPAAVLVPSVSDLGRRVLAHTYDAAAALAAGDNAVGLWLAPGWSAFEGVNPIMSFNLSRGTLVAAELRVQPAVGAAAGPRLSLSTNSSWRAAPSTTSHIGRWTNSDFGGDLLNLTLSIPGWATAAIDDAGPPWRAAEAVAALQRDVTPEQLEPTSVIGAVAAAAVEPCGAGCYNFTMAELFTGWIDVQDLAAADASAPVTISYSTNAGVKVEFDMVDQVVLSSTAAAAFRNRFSYHEVRFVTLENLARAPPLASVTGLRLMNARARVGDFSSSDPLLDAVYGGMVKTYEGLTVGGMSVDCPHRERLGYGGDAHTHLEFAMAAFESHNFFRKWARDWADVQGWSGDGGGLPHTAPTVDGGGGPAWGGFVIVMPWRLFETSGDALALAEAYPAMTAFVGFLLARVDVATGLLHPFGGSWDFLGDWVTPHGNEASDSIEAVLFNNCYLAHLLNLVSYAADALGYASGAAGFRAAHANVSAATHAAFFKTQGNSSFYLDTLQTHNVMPLVAGVVPLELVAAVTATLEHEIVVNKDGHLDTGLTGTYLMAKLLSSPEVGRDDLLHLMATQVTAPSYGALLAAGYTTWPEAWPGADSRMHGCLSGFGLFFTQGLLGVRPLREAPGMRTVMVRPAYGVGGLASARGATATPFGALANSWSWSPSAGVAHNLTVPANANALLWMPSPDEGSVTEGGAPASGALGVRFLRAEGNSSVWLLGSGNFSFASPWAGPAGSVPPARARAS